MTDDTDYAHRDAKGDPRGEFSEPISRILMLATASGAVAWSPVSDNRRAYTGRLTKVPPNTETLEFRLFVGDRHFMTVYRKSRYSFAEIGTAAVSTELAKLVQVSIHLQLEQTVSETLRSILEPNEKEEPK